MIKINGKTSVRTLFPDNTTQVWKLSDEIINSYSVDIEWVFDCESEFMELAQLKDLLDHHNVISRLKLPYLPYGRQDKEVSNETTFGLTTFARLLNSLNFNSVIITDPHSDRYQLINNSFAHYPITDILKIQKISGSDVFCFPDNGAEIKYSKILGNNYLHAEKERDQLTGKILDMNLYGNPKDLSILIIDDICDGGGTFCWLADLLYKAGAKEVNLYTTHGIFSKGLKPLKEANIKKIYTKDGEISEHQGNICYKEIK